MLLPKIAGLLLAAVLAGDPFSYEYSGTTDAKGTASVTLRANEAVDDLEIVIEGDGQTIRKTASMKKGGKQKITWTQKGSEARYEMRIQGKGVEASYAFDIVKTKAVGKAAPFKDRSSRDDIVKRRTATYQTPVDLAWYEYKVYDSDGDVIASKTVSPANVKANETFSFTWDAPAEVFMIEVRGEDVTGSVQPGYRSVPWAVEIPHTEINFDSGKWDVKAGEAPKLDEAVAVAFHELVALEKVNKAVNAQLTPQLYIVGYTDTVGPGPSNDKLSNNRAKAIAKYFYDKGFWAEIYYAGMGERALRVETPDNFDEERNRRALYVIGVQRPPAGGQLPAHWQKLSGARTKPMGFTLPALPEQWADFREKRRSGALHDEGGASGGGDDGSDSGSGPLGDPAEFRTGRREDEYGDSYGGDDGPPEVGGEPGATKKGCRVATETGIAPGLVILALVVPRRRRRRSRTA